MKNYLPITTLLFILTLQLTLADISLQEQNENQDQLNPVNEKDAEDSTNKHDKRTIFGPHKNVGWVKHVIIKNGHKKLLGYSPIDYKFAAIPRSVIVRPPPFTGYYHPKPIKAPIPVKPAVDNTAWKPIITNPGHIDLVHRPHIDVVQQRPHIDLVQRPHINIVQQRPHIDIVQQRPHIDIVQQRPHIDVVQQRPPHIDIVHQPHLDVVHNQPIPHVDQINLPPHVHQVPLDGHIHLQASPGHNGHVHLQPTGHLDVVQPTGHLDVERPSAVHLHQSSLPVYGDHIHQLNIPHNGHIDAFTHIDHIHPYAHLLRVAPTVFEVTKPNLGVLPLGTTFPSSILREASHFNLRPAILPASAAQVFSAQQFLPASDVHQILPATASLPHLHTQTHVHPVEPESLPHLHAQYQSHGHPVLSEALPYVHAQPGSLIEHHGNLAHRIVNHHPHQHLPSEEQNFLQQPLPAQLQVANQQGLWEQIPAHAAHLNIPQQELPLEGEQQVQHLNQNHLIQPGQTDVQIPFYLPNHPGWQNENIVKPSVTLEPPYKKQ